jgi:hypothetical protein
MTEELEQIENKPVEEMTVQERIERAGVLIKAVQAKYMVRLAIQPIYQFSKELGGYITVNETRFIDTKPEAENEQ